MGPAAQARLATNFHPLTLDAGRAPPSPDHGHGTAVADPSVPIALYETRPLAEEWTYAFLEVALAEDPG